MNKLNFLKNEFPVLLQNLPPHTKGTWGAMNAQQMVEHMAESISYATGNNNQKLHTPLEHIAKYKEFAMSDKEFKPNTKNALLSEVPAATEKATMQEAIAELKKQIFDFINYFESNKGATLTNAIFGDLNFEEWTSLLYKHAIHHSKQFELL